MDNKIISRQLKPVLRNRYVSVKKRKEIRATVRTVMQTNNKWFENLAEDIKLKQDQETA